MAELSTRSGVPVATIHFYLREGLLAPGRLTRPNQADYGEDHLRRLRLVRALLDVGGLSVARARGVVACIDEQADDLHGQLGRVQYALAADHPEAPDASLADVEQLIGRLGWRVRPDSPSRTSLAAALAALDRLGVGEAHDLLDEYAAALRGIADREVEFVLRRGEVEEIAEAVIATDLVGGALLLALRRLAHEAAVTDRIRP